MYGGIFVLLKSTIHATNSVFRKLNLPSVYKKKAYLNFLDFVFKVCCTVSLAVSGEYQQSFSRSL